MDRSRCRCLIVAVAAVKESREGFVESKGAVAPPLIEPPEPIRRRIRKKDEKAKEPLP